MLYFLIEGFIFSFGVVLNKVIIVARIQISISYEYLDRLDEFCDVAGATRSGVIGVLIRDYLDDLIEEVGKLSQETSDKEEGEDEEEDLEKRGVIDEYDKGDYDEPLEEPIEYKKLREIGEVKFPK